MTAPSSILLEIELVERKLTGYLLDPFVPLSRGLDPSTRIAVLRPPSKPFVERVESSDRASVAPHPAKRARLIDPPRFRTEGLPHNHNIGIQLEAAHHASIKDDIQSVVSAIQERWIEKCAQNGHLEWFSDLGCSRESSASAHFEWLPSPSPNFSTFDWASLTRDPQARGDLGQSSARVSETGITCINSSSNSVKTMTLADKTLPITLPARAGFSLATIENFKSEVLGLEHTIGWDAVIIDPPWENKSATRGGKYRTIELYDLFKLNLPGLLGENGGKKALIATWVTNRPKFRRFLKTKFLPDCHISGPYSEWYWVKISASPLENSQPVLLQGGKPLFDLESSSPRRCYEGLVLGWYTPPSLRGNTTLSDELPSKVFLSVPLNHSRKPNIFDLLEPHLPSDPSVLELFARSVSGFRSVGHNLKSQTNPRVSLKGRWHSVGDESPKFMVPPWVCSQISNNNTMADPE